MDIRQSPDDLVRTIRAHATTASDARQVTSRLRDLLPIRLASLKGEFAGRGGVAKAERQALADARFVAAVDEYVGMMKVALEARIQYETHVMLLDARRSLDAFRRSFPGK